MWLCSILGAIKDMLSNMLHWLEGYDIASKASKCRMFSALPYVALFFSSCSVPYVLIRAEVNFDIWVNLGP